MDKPILRNEIARYLFDHEDTRLVVVENPDGFLLRDDVGWELSSLYIVVLSGNSLALRILFETRFKIEQDTRFIFVKTETFSLFPDIAAQAEEKSFVAKSIFRKYKWAVIKNATLPTLEWLLSQKRYTFLSDWETSSVVREYEESYAATLEKIDVIEQEWQEMLANVDFNKPGQWMPQASRLLIRALAINQWDRMEDEITKLNDTFQTFLKENYVNVQSSSVPRKDKSPRIVTHVLPFIAKQDDNKTALVVVDGMNYWQGILLGNALKEQLDCEVQYDCAFAWLPSVTELSRQAIFKGDAPRIDYPQSPYYEEKLWKEFWKTKRLPDYSFNYQYEGTLKVMDNVNRQSYVTVGMDKLMHSSNNYKYLYHATKLWLQEAELIGNIKVLKEKGFKVFITTDHGNVETAPWKTLKQSEKVNAHYSLRHITIAPEASKEVFLAEWDKNELIQVEGQERTFYPQNRKVFSNQPTTVTHGGTHWLEVLIPFITI